MNATTTAEKQAMVLDLEPKADMPLAEITQGAMVAQEGFVQAPFSRGEEFILALLGRGVKAAEIGAVMDLRDRQDAKEQEQAMTKAMAGFKSETIEILKRKHVSFKTEKGWTEYDHAELADVVEAITPHLSKWGLSVTWKPTKQTTDWVEVTCWVKHDLGGSDQATLGAMPDKTGGKNNIQAIGSSCTYLSRYLTLLLLGLAAKGQDNDGRGKTPEGNAPGKPEPEIETYPPDRFAANLPKWSETMLSGRMTADQVIARAETQFPLTPKQLADIRAVLS